MVVLQKQILIVEIQVEIGVELKKTKTVTKIGLFVLKKWIMIKSDNIPMIITNQKSWL